MTADKPVVVGTDGSDYADRAIRWAAQYASRHDKKLLIATATSTPLITAGVGDSMKNALIDELKEHGDKIISAAVDIARTAAPTVTIETEIRMEPTTQAMMALSEQAEVMVVGARGLGAVASAFLGSVSSQLAAHAPCPVVVIPGADADPTGSPDGPVVVGVDASDNSVAAIAAAAREAAARQVPLVAVHAWSDEPVAAYPAINTNRAFVEEEVAETVLGEHLAGLREQYPDLKIEHRVVVDRPAKSLIKRSVGAQLVVVGSRGRGGFTSLVLGSTSAKVLRSAHSPVMIVRP